MQITDRSVGGGWLHAIMKSLARRWLALRYQLFDRRYGKLVIERIDDIPLLVLPDVFNPVLFRSGAYLARTVGKIAMSEDTSVLDLGSGTGATAIFAARQGARVTAVDLNPDAVRCTQINILLNDLDEQINAVEGDLFEPVKGQRFDLVVFNPPFYRGRPVDDRDMAWRSEDVFERFASELSAHLKPGGRGLLLLSSDGDGRQLLGLLQSAGLSIHTVASKILINEVMTLYEVKVRGD